MYRLGEALFEEKKQADQTGKRKDGSLGDGPLPVGAQESDWRFNHRGLFSFHRV
jgi:hypothetical protein